MLLSNMTKASSGMEDKKGKGGESNKETNAIQVNKETRNAIQVCLLTKGRNDKE